MLLGKHVILETESKRNPGVLPNALPEKKTENRGKDSERMNTFSFVQVPTAVSVALLVTTFGVKLCMPLWHPAFHHWVCLHV